MKFSKILLVLAALTAVAFAEEAPETQEQAEEVPVKEEKAKIKAPTRTKEQCEQGYQLLQNYYAEDVETNPKCTYSKEYAEKNNLVGDYTMDIKNRDYFCTECLTKYLKLGNPMINACGENAPNEMLYDLYFLSAVNSIICAKDKLQDRYCEVVMDELFEKENNKPIINWKENTLCGECPYYYHNIFKEREEFYKSVSKDSSENSFIGRILPLHDIDLDCFKEFDFHRQQAIKEAKEKAASEADVANKKKINFNEMLEDAKKTEEELKQKLEEAKAAAEAEEDTSSSEEETEDTSSSEEESSSSSEEEKAKEKTEEKVEEKTEEKVEEKTEEKVEEKPKKPADEL